MRIAICFSGQPRTWERCIGSWNSLIDQLKNRYNASVDIFCHAWDFNTPPNCVFGLTHDRSAEDMHYYLTDEEKNLLISSLNPKSYIFESVDVSKAKALEIIKRGRIYESEHGGTPIPWAASQYYGLMRVCHLKKLHESNNGFMYDVCIRLRYDLHLAENEIAILVQSSAFRPSFNKIYSVHCGIDNTGFPWRRLGDILWVAESMTFDKMCEFYRWMPVIGLNPFPKETHNALNPEKVLFYYTKMLKIAMEPLHVDPKICRFSNYIDQKVVCGLNGELGGYEFI